MKPRWFSFWLLAYLNLATSDIANAQPRDQRDRLLQFGVQQQLKWRVERATAESMATANRLPIRIMFPSGKTLELQRIEHGLAEYFITMNLDAAGTISTNRVWPGGTAGLSLTGAGVLLGIWDAGRVRREHQEFSPNRVNQIDGSTQNHYHATHVAGTMVALGMDQQAHGMAHQAQLDAYDWNNDFSEMANAALAGLNASNHSYGKATGWDWDDQDNVWRWFGDLSVSVPEDYRFGFYGSRARDLDDLTHIAPNYLVVVAAGNDGTDTGTNGAQRHGLSKETYTDMHDRDGGVDGYDCIAADVAVSKNVLTVGAVHDIANGYVQPSDVEIADFSSWVRLTMGESNQIWLRMGHHCIRPLKPQTAPTEDTVAHQWLRPTFRDPSACCCNINETFMETLLFFLLR